MVKMWIKFLKKQPKHISESIYLIIQKIINNNLENLDIKEIKGKKDLYRCRQGNRRIIFSYETSGEKQKIIIKNIGFRGDIYKN